MKTLTIIFLMICNISLAQNNLTLIQSPGSYDDGFSIGLEYTFHDTNKLYYGGEIYLFPDLNNNTYTHILGKIGLNYYTDNWETIRFYSGIRLGLINRYDNIHAIAGLEAGVDYKLFNNLFIGMSVAGDMRGDVIPGSKDGNHKVASGLIRLGFRF